MAAEFEIPVKGNSAHLSTALHTQDVKQMEPQRGLLAWVLGI